MPLGRIGNVSISRLIIGGNLIGGFAHARDLMYASKLFTAYNTEAKIFETLEIAQACGINTIQMNPDCWDVVAKYNRNRQTKIQTIVCIGLTPAKKARQKMSLEQLVDGGATMLYTHGGDTDRHMMNGGKIDEIGELVAKIKSLGVPAGVGGHSLKMPMACEASGIDADFYIKTFHMDRYWSATPEENRQEYDWMRANAADHNANNDAMWCNNPEETAAFMEKVDKPWIAFKVMAAGAIKPQFAFQYAFRHGADFVLAGMFDFQVEDDAKIAIAAVKKSSDRRRPWCA